MVTLYIGAETAAGCLGEKTHIHYRNLRHNRSHGHSGMERDPPQDREHLQLLRSWLPRPQLPGQCSDGAVSAGSGGLRHYLFLLRLL